MSYKRKWSMYLSDLAEVTSSNAEADKIIAPKESYNCLSYPNGAIICVFPGGEIKRVITEWFEKS